MAGFIFVLKSMIDDNRNFYQHLEYSFGLKLSKIIGLVYVVWGILLTSVQMRYYAQRVASTIYTEIGMDIFIVIMVFICVYALRNGISVVARMNEIFLPVIAVVAVLLLSLLTPDVEAKVLVPVNDWKSLTHVAVFNLASFGYLSFILFFTDEISEREKFKKNALLATLSVTLFSVWLFVTVIGTLGPHIVEKLPYPFFAVVKQISLGEFLQHIEAFVITLWILSDFVLISFIGAAVVKLFGGIIRARETREFYLPYFVLCATLVNVMGRTNYEVELLSEKVFIPLNLVFLFILPFITFVFGKIKKALRSKAKL
jgi:spore germination protein KB